TGMTRPLPAPARLVVTAALHTAVGRWPTYQRDELAREWAAELYMIAHDPRSTTARRAWRSLGFALSLACARGPEQQPTTWGYAMRKNWKTMVGLVLAPSVIAAMVVGVALVAAELGWRLGYGVPEGVTDRNAIASAAPPVDLGPVAALLCALAVGLVGYWLGRRFAMPLVSPVVSAACVAGLTIVGFSVALTVATPLRSPMFGMWASSELLGLIYWGALLPLVMVGVQLVRGQFGGSAAAWAAVPGGFAAVVVGAQGSGVTLTRLPEVFVVWWISGLFPHVLLATTIFALTYLLARPVSVPAEPAGVTG
ncbi:MAG: hypothetical protein ACRDTM_02870, partial [Micromonosporaceae bacterium]